MVAGRWPTKSGAAFFWRRLFGGLLPWWQFRIHASTAVLKEDLLPRARSFLNTRSNQMKPLSFDDLINAGYLSRYPHVDLRAPSSDGSGEIGNPGSPAPSAPRLAP